MKALPDKKTETKGNEKGTKAHSNCPEVEPPSEVEPAWITALRICFHQYVESNPQRFDVTVHNNKRGRLKKVTIKSGERP